MAALHATLVATDVREFYVAALPSVGCLGLAVSQVKNFMSFNRGFNFDLPHPLARTAFCCNPDVHDKKFLNPLYRFFDRIIVEKGPGP